MRNVDEIKQTNEELKARSKRALASTGRRARDSNKRSDGAAQIRHRKRHRSRHRHSGGRRQEGSARLALRAWRHQGGMRRSGGKNRSRLDKARTEIGTKGGRALAASGALWPTSTTRKPRFATMPKPPNSTPMMARACSSWAQLQARAGYLPAAKQSFERLIALGDRIENEQQRPLGLFPPGRRRGRARKSQSRPGPLQARPSPCPSASSSAIPTTPNGSAISPSAMTSSATSAPPAATATARSKPIRTASTFESSSPRATPTTPNGSAISPSAMNKIGDISAARGDRDGALKAYQGRPSTLQSSSRRAIPTTPNGSAISP